MDEFARTVLFYNKFGAPVKPHRSIEDIMAFLGGSETYDNLFDFLSYNPAMDVNSDNQNGLDTWMADEDEKMIEIYKESLKKDHH